MKNEIKTRIKIFILFVVMAAAAFTTLIFFYISRENLQNSKREVEEHKNSLKLIKELIISVDDAQQTLQIYSTFKQLQQIDRINSKIQRVDSIANELAALIPNENDFLKELAALLNEQLRNFKDLNNQLLTENPINKINQKLKDVNSEFKDSVVVLQVKHDSVIVKPTHKSFFKRFGELFKPKKDTLTTVFTKTDTIKHYNVDTLSIISQAGKIAMAASDNYESNISTIINRINLLMGSNQELSGRINYILYQLHSRMLNSALAAISNSEQALARNYTFSIIGVFISILLILLFIIMIITDVNKVQKARNNLEIANNKVKEIMESRHKLMLATSHDIKSPLSSIIGYLQMSDTQNEQTQAMQNSVKYILALLENMLNFSNIEQGTLTVTNSCFNLKDLGNEINQMFMPLALAKKLNFRTVAPDVSIESDIMKLKQILINIVSNAVKYTQQGQIDVNLSYNKQSQLLNIVVSDTGAGIAPNELEQLFKPFVRIDRNNNLASGNGYGMFVVKGLVDLLKGSISINSVVQKGTSINITLPATYISGGKNEEGGISGGKNGLEVSSGSQELEVSGVSGGKNELEVSGGNELASGTLCAPKKIIIFDDQPQIVELAQKMLEHLGHTIVEEDYDIILTDMDMNPISGLDVLASAGTIPVVLMSGRSDLNKEQVLQMGFKAFIQKPLSIEVLQEIFGKANPS